MENDNIGNINNYNNSIDAQLKILNDRIKTQSIKCNITHKNFIEARDNYKKALNKVVVKSKNKTPEQIEAMAFLESEDERKIMVDTENAHKSEKIELDYLNNEFSRVMELSYNKGKKGV